MPRTSLLPLTVLLLLLVGCVVLSPETSAAPQSAATSVDGDRCPKAATRRIAFSTGYPHKSRHSDTLSCAQ